MMIAIARWLRRVADWLDGTTHRQADQLPIVRQLVAWADTQPAMPNEVKRQEVLVRLQRTFPYTAERHLAYLIEQAIQEQH